MLSYYSKFLRRSQQGKQVVEKPSLRLYKLSGVFGGTRSVAPEEEERLGGSLALYTPVCASDGDVRRHAAFRLKRRSRRSVLPPHLLTEEMGSVVFMLDGQPFIARSQAVGVLGIAHSRAQMEPWVSVNRSRAEPDPPQAVVCLKSLSVPRTIGVHRRTPLSPVRQR